MAVSSGGSGSEEMSAGRRFAIGANVTLAVIAAAALLVAVNWLASLKYARRDVAASAHFGLSDRTKRILDECPGDIQLSVLYSRDSQDEKQRGYVDRLQDYGDELQGYSGKVKVKYVASESQRTELAAKIGEKSGGEAEKHREALASFEKLREELGAEIRQRLTAAQALMTESSWLGDFPHLAGAVSRLRAAQESLDKAAEEIKQLTPAGGIPKYADATAKAKQTLTEIKEYLGWIDKNLGDLTALADEASKPDSASIAMLRSAAQEADGAVATLRATVGAQAAPLPEDPAAPLRNFKEQGDVVAKKLDDTVGRVDDFARKYPVVRQHANWSAAVRMGPMTAQMEVAGVLENTSKSLGQIRLAILSVLDRGDANQLRDALSSARENVTVLEQNVAVCRQLLTEVADRLSRVDDGSKALLDAARGGALMAERVKTIDELAKTFEGLPELKLGSVADQLKEENAIVVEALGKVRVLGFADVFPVRESVAGPASSSAEDMGRTFNGDAAISSAILSLSQDHPVATVVLVSFEPPAPPQRGPFSPPPPQSWIPTRSLAPLRRRLEAANFKVKDWNLADEDSAQPKPEEGTENVYVLLPPAPPAQPNPFNQQQAPPQTFGEEQRRKIRDLLADDARMIFLGTWEVASGGPFGGPPTTPLYGYGPILDRDWGIVVDNTRRVVWIEPDRQKLDTFMVAPRRFNHMPANGFTDQPIGEPMRGTRFLINDACPIEIRKELPAGVKAATVLRIPPRENYIAAKLPEMFRIIDQLQSFSDEGRVTLTPFPSKGPFDIMVAAERTEGEASKGKIVVMGFGDSLRGDYLENPVPVVGTGDVLRLDPPPSENLDLFVNALYWLQGQAHRIARGPVPVPQLEPIEAGTLRALRAFTYGVWPLIVFAPGVFFWWARRR